MIDNCNNVFLIEANVNPDLSTSSPTLNDIIPNLIDNVFKIALDPLFPPSNWPKHKKHLIPDQIYETNRFELVFDEKYEGENLYKIIS